ncbi:MAG: preprotein translocase subunit SecG [Limisphaerales bacterium]
MSIAIGLLTFVLMLIALFVILLVLVQLPKKEAGVGMAFGAGMSEMLLGAGSGNVLTRITKYSVGIFLGLALVLSILISSHYRSSGLSVSRALEEKARASQAVPPTTPDPANSGLQPLVTTPTTEVSTTPLVSTTTVVSPAPVLAVPAPSETPTAPTPTTPLVTPVPETPPATPAVVDPNKPAGN